MLSDLDDVPPPRPLHATKFDFRGMCSHGPACADEAQQRRQTEALCPECGNLLQMTPEGIWYVAERACERVAVVPLSVEQGRTLVAEPASSRGDPAPTAEPIRAPGALRTTVAA